MKLLGSRRGVAGLKNLHLPPLLQKNRAGAGFQVAFFRCGVHGSQLCAWGDGWGLEWAQTETRETPI